MLVNYREKKAKEKMEGERKDKELEEAKQLQNSLLPKENPAVNGFDISTYLKPATEIGGDYYDFFYKEGEYFYAICGDATGHGVVSGIMVSQQGRFEWHSNGRTLNYFTAIKSNSKESQFWTFKDEFERSSVQ